MDANKVIRQTDLKSQQSPTVCVSFWWEIWSHQEGQEMLPKKTLLELRCKKNLIKQSIYQADIIALKSPRANHAYST